MNTLDVFSRVMHGLAAVLCLVLSPFFWMAAVYFKALKEPGIEWSTTFAMAVIPAIACGRYALFGEE